MGYSKKKCLICNKYLRKLSVNSDWLNRAYHIHCWKIMIKDIKNFDKICYVKYDYDPLIEGKTLEEWREIGNGIVVHFD
tara:strand:- start:18147 stop:18383 length:237 start_codon:yes stop_codon:yes gene_type:complete